MPPQKMGNLLRQCPYITALELHRVPVRIFFTFFIILSSNIQNLGEDWTNAALILSTVASDTIARCVPYLRATKIYSRSKATGSLFGANVNNGQTFGKFQQQPQNLFGQPQQSFQSNTGDIFGQTQQSFPSNTGGVFGQPQQSFPSNTGGLFGQSQRNAVGVFGAPAAASSAGPTFGAAPSAASGLFGSQSAPAPPPAPQLFGQPQQNAAGIFGAPAVASSAGPAFGAAPSGASGFFGSQSAPAPPPAPQDDSFSSFEEVTVPGPLSEPTTIVTESPLSVSYGVEGESTIPSDGVAHQVSVAVLAFDSKVTHVCCPKIDPRVYLQVRFYLVLRKRDADAE